MIYAAGFRENCDFQIEKLPELEFTLGQEKFSVSPKHYIAKEEEVDENNNKVDVCVLLIGVMEMGGGSKQAPMIILGTPFIRANYIQFAHPKGENPHVWIHETCPDDADKEALEHESSNIQRKTRKVSAMTVDANGTLSREPEPVLRSQVEKTLSAVSRVERLERIPVKPLHGKNWIAAMRAGKECTPTMHPHKYKDTKK